MNPTLAIGLDGGGTRTRAIVEIDEGARVGFAESGPANPHSVGFARARRNATEAALLALEAAARKPSDVGSVALGAAGLADATSREQMRAGLAGKFRHAAIHVYSDAEIALAATGSSANATGVVAVIAGTGSIALARGRNGVIVRAGGYGFRIGDEGSGAWIAREALAAAERALDGRGPATLLVDGLCRALDSDSAEFRLAAHRTAESAHTLAALAPVVAAAADRGDSTARALLRDAGERLAELAACVTRKARSPRDRAPVALSVFGGVFERIPRVERSFRRRLRELVNLKPIPPRVSPEIAAIELARFESAKSERRR